MPPPSALAVIPARYASTRLPGKPLLDRTGKPLIQHVVEHVQRAACVTRTIVATDDARIYDAVRAFGGEPIMTRAEHPNGTARIAEAVEQLEQTRRTAVSRDDDDRDRALPDLIVNVQGDEPELDPAVIDQLVTGLAGDADAPMATLAAPFADDEDPRDPNIVKLIVDQRGRALYFSRSLIPFDRDGADTATTVDRSRYLKHPGMYAYRRAFLPRYAALPATPLEQREKLEQLRAIEHGHPIAVVHADVRHHGIDTPEQYDAFVHRCATRPPQS